MRKFVLTLTALCLSTPAWPQTPAPSPSTKPPATQTTTVANPDALHARGPESVAQQTPDKIVATIGGKPVTARQAVDLLKPLRPEDRKRFESNLAALVQQIYMEEQLANQAAALKLDTQSPYKEQLEIARANILTQAYLTKKATDGPGAPDPKAYYDSHAADYEQIKLSGIVVAFNAPGTPAGAPGVNRTEAQAQDKANDLEKKIKAGGDFSALARTDSDNQQSSVRGGELGTFLTGDKNIPGAVKTAVTNLQAGQISEPVRMPNGFYILRVDSRGKLPFDQVKPGIEQQIQSERAQIVLNQERDNFKIQVQDPDFFNSGVPATAPRVPSLQRPGTPASSGPTGVPQPNSSQRSPARPNTTPTAPPR